MPIGAIATGIATLAPIAINAVQAGIQAKRAKELSKVKRPMYDIPSGYQGGLDIARQMYENPVTPAMTRGIDDSVADATYKALEYGDPNKGIFTANMLAEKKGDIVAGITADSRNRAAQNYQQGLFGMGQKQDFQWMQNELNPYEAAKAAESALREGAFRNLSNSVGQASNNYFDYKLLSGGGGGKTDDGSWFKDFDSSGTSGSPVMESAASETVEYAPSSNWNDYGNIVNAPPPTRTRR